MTQEAHTPEPWKVHGGMLGHKGDIFVPTAKSIQDCHHVARCFAPKPSKKPVCDLQIIQMEREAIATIEANARRIVACINALAGIPIEAIESGVVAELVGAAKQVQIKAENACLYFIDMEDRQPLVQANHRLRNALAKLEASK